jgi:diguanylate cyclase (GGDEF)-like protein
MPLLCQKDGATLPRVIIQLKIDKVKGVSSKGIGNIKGFLCMCGLEHAKVLNQSLLHYKAKLVKDILNLHLTNVAQYQDARIASLTDGLTKVGSRRYFEDMLENETSRAGRYSRSFSIGIIDVDKFKEINDKFGHTAGDAALKQLAECMKGLKRNSDILARYGGDEFVIILPETGIEGAEKMIERIRNKAHEIKIADNLFLSVSCGVAQAPLDRPVSGIEMIRRADSALYRAKNGGRDCTKIWSEETDESSNDSQVVQSELSA